MENSTDVPRDTKQYYEGVAAYRASLSDDKCPYPIGDGRRTGWYTGYLDARTNDRLGEVFEKWGMKHP